MSPLDALQVINELNLRGSYDLPAPLVAPNLPPSYFDVSGDGVVSPLDVLQLINDLNANGPRSVGATSSAEGEGAAVVANSTSWSPPVAPLLTSNAADRAARTNTRATSRLFDLDSRENFVAPNECSGIMPLVDSHEDHDKSSDSWQELESYLVLCQD